MKFSLIDIPLLGLALVFVWFGIDKFVHPQIWIFWQPAWMNGFLGFDENGWNIILGIKELVFAALLLIPTTRWIGGLAMAVYLLPIIYIGWPGDIAVRDLGIFSVAVYFFLKDAPSRLFCHR